MNDSDDTEYLSSIPGMKEKIIDGMDTPLEECVADEDICSERLEKRFKGYQGDTKCAELDWDVGKEIIK